MNTTHPKVILVEDDADLRDALAHQLELLGIEVRTAGHAGALDALLEVFDARIVVLDVHLPGEDGFSITRRLYDPARRGIVMTTARGEVEDRIRGITGGADACLVKPVDLRELAAMIRHIDRRFTPVAGAGDSGWHLDPALKRLQSPDGDALDLAGDEFAVLRRLLDPPGAVCDRDDILAHLGEHQHRYDTDARLNALLCRLRQKLLNFHHSLRIHTWRSRGYAFAGPPIAVADRQPPGRPAPFGKAITPAQARSA